MDGVRPPVSRECLALASCGGLSDAVPGPDGLQLTEALAAVGVGKTDACAGDNDYRSVLVAIEV